MKKHWAFILQVSLLICLCTCTVFAAQSTDKVIYSNTGGNLLSVQTARGVSSEISTAPLFKPSGDSTLHVFGTSTVNCLSDNSGMNYLNLGVANKVGAVKTYKKLTIQFDALLTEEGTGIGFRGGQSGGSKTTFMKLFCGTDFAKNTWNRFAFVIGADGNDNTYIIYINGVEYQRGYTTNGTYGFSELGWITCHCNINEYFNMYVDNIKITGGDMGYVSDGMPKVVSATNSVELLNNSDLKIPADMTVSKLLSSITTDDASNTVKVYNESGSVIADSSVMENGAKLSLQNSEGIYSYYNIGISAPGIYLASGSENVASQNGAGLSVQQNYIGAPLKESDDSAYRISGTSTWDLTYDSHGQSYIDLKLGNLIGDNKNSKVISVEFQFCLMNDGNGVSFRGKQCGVENKTFVKLFAGKDVEVGKWYKLLITIDASGDESASYRVYLNDKLLSTTALDAGAYGFENYGWIVPHAEKGSKFEMYIDNIACYAGDEAHIKNEKASIENVNADNEINKIYNVPTTVTVKDFVENIVLTNAASKIYAIDENSNIVSANSLIKTNYCVVTLSKDGVYSYYYLDSNDKSLYIEKNKNITAGAALNAKQIGCNEQLFEINNNSVELMIEFDKNTILPEDIKKENIWLTTDAGNVTTYNITPVYSGDFVSAVKITVNSLSSATKYIIHLKNLRAKKSFSGSTFYTMSSEQNMFFATLPVSNGTDQLMANIICNIVNSNYSGNSGWGKYGGLQNLSMSYDAAKGKDVIAASGRTGYYHGIVQAIPYKDLYKYTGDTPGTKSTYELSYNIKSDRPSNSNEELVLTFTWYINGVGESEGVYTATKEYSTTMSSLPTSTWKSFKSQISLDIPQEVANSTNSFLRIHIENNKDTTTKSNFYVSDFSLRKLYGGNKINLEINENSTVKTIENNVLGYAVEGGYWYSDYHGAVVYKGTNQWKPEFLDLVSKLNMKVVRFGGYTTNYEFWKCSLGDISQRIPVYAPAPDWDTAKDYWREGIEYIGPMERLQLAEAFNKDASVIMCTNIWSYLPNIDYNAKYTTSITPEKIVQQTIAYYTYNGVQYPYTTYKINYDGLQVATNDLIDFIRFCTLMPNDAKAVGSDGINWAQKRVELGHANPYNIDIWELGNEFYCRGISGNIYVDMCNYVIPKVREVFPDLKLAAHIDSSGASYNWREYVINNLATKIDYVAMHPYYSYNAIPSASNNVKTVGNIIKSSANPNIKCILTEGGLDIFRDYVGPSDKSIAMSVSFADFVNRISCYDALESFEYFGSAVPICYNDVNSVKPGWDYSSGNLVAEETKDSKGEYIKLGNRTDYNQGIWQDIAFSDFKAINHFAGEKSDYKFSYSVKFDSDNISDEDFSIEMEWISNTNVVSKTYRKVFASGDYTPGEWIDISETLSDVTIPSSFDGSNKEFLRIIIKGDNASQTYSDICIKDFKLIKAETSGNLATNKFLDISNDTTIKPTALAEVMRYYTDHANGDIVYTNNASSITSTKVSSLAFKTDNGIRVFITNTDTNSDYTINLNTVGNYSITGKYLMYANDIYAERNNVADDIYTIREYYSSNEALNSVVIPKDSIMVLDLGDYGTGVQGFSKTVSLDEGTVRVTCQNSDGECDIIAAFLDNDNNLLDSVIKHIGDGNADILFTSNTSYKKVKLFKWVLSELIPLAECELYKAE